MTDLPKRTRVITALLVVSTIALVLVAASGAVPPLFSDDSPDRPDDPTTEGTVGYVDGYWYDDELPADDRDGAVVEDDELDAVVARSMARVEKIRGMTFQEDVPVEVISREEFRNDRDVFVESTEDERLQQNVTYEALFMVDNETNASAELEAMYGGSVDGYYQPSENQIVVVSEDPENPELDEIILGHELVHALQDQHYDLTSYDRETIDQDNAKNGLVEGDARWVDIEYDERCGSEWDCLSSGDSSRQQPPQLNWGIYLALYQPYSDGPAYIDSLREAADGWTAVNDAYDDPPTSSSTVIHREDREPTDVTVDDRSSESWERLRVDGEVTTEVTGEAAMVAMFGAGALDPERPSVIDSEALLRDDLQGFDYDQPYTDGWAGDELVTYVDADAGADATADDAGYVWESEWRSSEDARQFVTGYLELLDLHDAEAVDDRRDTYVIDDEYPGAYYLEVDGETVTIVRAPSVDELDAIVAGAAPEGEDTLERVPVDASDDGDDGAGNDDGDDSNDDPVPGFAVPGTVIAVSIVLLGAGTRGGPVRVRIRRRSR